MNTHEAEVNAIITLLKGVPCCEALQILASAIGYLASQADLHPDHLGSQEVHSVKALHNVQLARRHKTGPESKLSRFPEVRDYLNNLDRYLTLKELNSDLISRFGTAKTPSKSSLHRYIKSSFQSTLSREVSHEK